MSVAWAGLAMGLLGSAHCVGMCGGIAGALSAAPFPNDGGSAVEPPSTRGSVGVQRSLLYNVGRVTSYTALGAVAGAFGSALAGPGGAAGALLLRGVAALLIVAVGLSLAGWAAATLPIERAGAGLWRRVAPLARKARASSSPLAPLGVGVLWGWLPCGLVYSALAIAASAGSGADGAMTMAAFGIGTLPAVLAVGLFAAGWVARLRSSGARRLVGVVVIVFGIWTFAAAASAYRATPAGETACHESTPG